MSNETTTPTPELAPCPRCGRNPFFDRVTAFSGAKTVGFKVECVVSCGLRIFTETDTPDEAAASWNALALDVQRGKLAAKLAEAFKNMPTRIKDCGCAPCKAANAALAEYDALTAKEATR